LVTTTREADIAASRVMIVTCEANRVRNSDSSPALLPPPMTITSRSR